MDTKTSNENIENEVAEDINTITTFTNSRRITRTKKKLTSITPEICHKGLTEEIVSIADRIYDDLSKKIGVKRKRKRQKLLFYCVLAAHLEIAKPHDPIDLGKLFNLTEEDIHNTYSLFSSAQTCYTLTQIDHVKCFLDYFSEKLNLNDESKQELREIYEDIKERDEIRDMKPRSLASGIIDYYLTVNGSDVEDLPKVVNQTTSLIKKARDIVMKYR